MAKVSALSPRPAHPPKTAVSAMALESAKLAEAPESTELAEAAVVAPPKAKPRQWQLAVLQS